MQSYEVEVKSLLGSEERANELRDALQKIDPACELISKNKQLNHYFEGGTLEKLAEVVSPHLSALADVKLNEMIGRMSEFSIRSRDKNGTVYLVVKASVGEDSSENGVARIEFEEKMDMSLEELDQLMLSAGFTYQAKWSREREEYLCKNVNVTLDKNAGYGWLAEFERVVDDQSKVEAARAEVIALMQELGIDELPQARLERMFSFYNAHWQEYYGTDTIFTVE
ncbi:MAG: CYTH domain-containing protein [Candidatus Pacebacteria bacterium]|nr:CYTH domain-containing protein [Candidatus Paceibacterota bacterium]